MDLKFLHDIIICNVFFVAVFLFSGFFHAICLNKGIYYLLLFYNNSLINDVYVTQYLVFGTCEIHQQNIRFEVCDR